jgi:MSHA biogenesis protein MshP
MSRLRGFALVSALFLIVVLSALGAFLVDLVAVQHATPAMRVRAARADYAARSGMAWAVHRALDAGVCGDANFNLGEGALAGYAVSVRCSSSVHDLSGAATPYYVIDVSAQAGEYGGTDFVARSLQAKVGGS